MSLSKQHYVQSPGGLLLGDTSADDLERIFAGYAATEPAAGMVLHFPGGLGSKRTDLQTAGRLLGEYQSAGTYPVFFVSETGLLECVCDRLSHLGREPLFRRWMARLTEFCLAEFGLTGLPQEQVHATVDAWLCRSEQDKGPTPFDDISPNLTAESDVDAIRQQIQDKIADDEELRAGLDALSKDAQAGGRGEGEPQAVTTRDSRQTLMTADGIQKLLGPPAGRTGGAGQPLSNLAAFTALIVHRTARRCLNRRDHGLWTTMVEEVLREFYLENAGGALWSQMKTDAAAAFGNDPNLHAGTAFLSRLNNRVEQGWRIPRITLVGHSAGALHVCNFLQAAETLLPNDVAFDVVFLAPVVTHQQFGRTLAACWRRIRGFRMFSLSDNLERKDALAAPVYPRSLLYYVSGVLEDEPDEPVLGMQRFFGDVPPMVATDDPQVARVRDFLHASEGRCAWDNTDDGDTDTMASPRWLLEIREGLNKKTETLGGAHDETMQAQLPPPGLPSDPHFDKTVAYSDATAGAYAGPPPPAPKSLPENFGRYEVREIKGRGGFGTVYIGYDPQLKRRVAIKVPHESIVAEDGGQQFLHEARRLAQLSHPGIVTVFDVGVQEGRCYIVSDYLEGGSLKDWLKEHRPTWQEAARIVAEVADALAYAHAHRIIHRDVKPDNVILKDGKTPVLVDFGLALSDDDAIETHRGFIAGTPHYMSPEQAQGKAHRIDGRTDVYSLGVVLYQLLCGQTPFRGSDLRELLRQVCKDDPQPLRQLVPDLPPELERICQKSMAKQAGQRFTSAADMAGELRALLETLSVSLPSAPLAPFASQPEIPTSDLASSIRRAREAERRQVTVLYCECDLFDSAEFFENLDPEEQHEVLTEYQQACDEVIDQFGGAVLQSTGQSLLVCFGYPTAYEDAAHRSVHVALGIQQSVARLNDRLRRQYDIQLSVWIGIHTGLVVAEESAEDGTREPMSIVGEARNIATRLNVAEDAEVVVSQATHRLIEGFFVCENVGTHRIRGASRPVEVFKVVGKSEARTRIEAADAGKLTPLVGRNVEVGMLQERWEIAAEGMGQVVLLVGDAGLGKSRLIHEIRALVDTEEELAGQVVEWRCSPYYQNSGLYPATEYFQRALALQRDDSPAQSLEKLVRYLDQFDLATQETVPLFASLLSIPTDERYPALSVAPQRLKELTQEALLDWLRRAAAKQPVLFIIEDLHWMDPSTLELLSLLVEQGTGDAILGLFTFRPEFSPPWASKTHQTQIALNRLTKRQIGEMMEKQTGLKMLPADLVAQVVSRTDGVPLFVEEFTKVIQESGELREVDGEVQLSDSFTLDAIPSTLQDLLISRLNRMEGIPDVVQMAATLGREFSYELLQAALVKAVPELDEPAFQAELDKLVQAELVFQTGRPPRSTYTFKHALIQDAAYDSLLKKKRQQFHQMIAQSLEEQFPETAESQPELLARHFTEAGLNEQGASYWLKAGQRSQQRSANTEAIRHLTQGLELLQTLDESPQRDRLELGMQVTLGPVLMVSRGWGADEVGTTLERARELCEKAGAVTDQFFVTWGIWGWRLLRLELDLCWPLADDVMRLVNDSPEGQELKFEAHWIPGGTAYYEGDFATGLAHCEQGLALYDPQRARDYTLRTGQDVAVMYRSYIALSLWDMGFPDQALKQADESIRFGRELGHPFSLVMALYHRRRLLEFCGLEDQARQSMEEEYRICCEQGFPLFEAHAMLAQAADLVKQGRLDEAREQLERGAQIGAVTGCKLSMSHPFRLIAEAFLDAGLYDDARQWLDLGLGLDEAWLRSELQRLNGELARATGDDEEAEVCFRRAIEIAKGQNAKSWELRAAMSLSRLLQSHGKREEARVLLQAVYDWFTEGFATHDLVAAKSLLEELAR